MPEFDPKYFNEMQERKTKTRELKILPASVNAAILQIVGISGKRSDWFKTCITCTHWQEHEEICKKFNARPPIKIIVDSCEQYEDYDMVPF